MKSQDLVKTIVGIVLVLFLLAVSTIFLFGLTNTVSGNMSLSFFKTIYFILIIVIMIIFYLVNEKHLNGLLDHVFVILIILLFSISFANFIGVLKSSHDTNQYILNEGDIKEIESTNTYYQNYYNSMSENFKSVKSNNDLLEKEIGQITEKINNKEPIIIETIITLPPEIIYEYEPINTNNYYDENVYKDEEDD